MPSEAGTQTVRLGRWRVMIGDQEVAVDATREAVDVKSLAVRWPGRSPGGGGGRARQQRKQ